MHDHLEHLIMLISTLASHKLFINLKKCLFLVTEISFLGFIIGHNAVKMDPTKILAISEWPEPTTAREIHVFLDLSSQKIHKTL